jgi:hypothetical protein
MNTDGAITTAAKYTVSPHNALHFRQKLPVDLTPFSIQFAQGIDCLIRGHVLRVFIVGHIEEAAFGTKATMGTK